jgi:hypothetical protein
MQLQMALETYSFNSLYISDTGIGIGIGINSDIINDPTTTSDNAVIDDKFDIINDNDMTDWFR